MRTLVLPCIILLSAIAAPLGAQDKKESDLATRLKALKAPNEPFTLIVHFQVKKGEEKAILASAAPCIEATRKEKGCITYEMHQDLEDPTKFVFFERWKSVKELGDHLDAEHTKKFVGSLGKALVGDPKFQFYR